MRFRCAVAAVVVVGLVGSINVAGAQAKSTVSPFAAFKGTNGYSVNVYKEYSGDGVIVSVARGEDAYATYTGKGKADGKAIKATLKGFAKINLKFEPKGKAKTVKPPKGCKGASTKYQKGTWVGKFTFEGEGGYTKVSAKSGKGGVNTLPAKPLDCGDNDPTNPGNPKPCVNVSANVSVPGGSLTFYGSKIDGKEALFSAFYNGEKDGIKLSKSASSSGGTLTANGETGTGTAAPGAPFSGTGTFADGQLTGSLKVELPGLDAKITGEGYASEGTCTES